jgi:hypothetical protein
MAKGSPGGMDDTGPLPPFLQSSSYFMHYLPVRPRVLLVNPPIYDFSAYDFWLKPYGLLRIGGMMRGSADLELFDYLDRLHPSLPKALRSYSCGIGRFYEEQVEKPVVFEGVPRRYKRYGLKREVFQRFLATDRSFDFVLIAGSLTFWYLGVREVIADVRELMPRAKIVLGGVYPTLCPAHAESLGADLVVRGNSTADCWNLLGLTPNEGQPPLWESYAKLDTAVIKLTQGCPFACTYCSVRQHYPEFKAYPLANVRAELELLAHCGVRNIAFYDDALLVDSRGILFPFLDAAAEYGFCYHTPNALHARLLNAYTAERLVKAGFEKLYLGFESSEQSFSDQTGSKSSVRECAAAVQNLLQAGARPEDITAYVLIGHPALDLDMVEKSLRLASSFGIQVMLAEFSPIPNTPDGELCRSYIDLDEPLSHNKTVFPILRHGEHEVNRLKELCRELNRGQTS